MAQTSGYSYPRVTVIRIDVHPVGENLTNTPHTFHAQSAYGPRSYISHMVHIQQPFTRRRQIWMDPTAPKKKGRLTQSTARRSIPSFSPEPTNKAVGISQAHVGDQLLGLLGP
jgi:hypothetical protein